MVMTPKEPYVIRALYEWILDNDCTPYIVVDTLREGVQVPQEYVEPDGKIIFNISPTATGNLVLADEAIEFAARFGGKPYHVRIPCYAVMGIFAKETQQGEMFHMDYGFTTGVSETKSQSSDNQSSDQETDNFYAQDQTDGGVQDKTSTKTATKQRKGSHLSLVK